MFQPGRPLTEARTLAEFQGFVSGHFHRLELMPVVRPRFDYRCECGGTLALEWTAELASKGIEDALLLAYRQLGQMEATSA
jgi:hypothetical protein